MKVVQINTSRIVDWPTFHAVFAETFGFPEFYGQNMDAWIDCMTSLDEPEAGLSMVHSEIGGIVTLQLEQVDDFMKRCPEQYRSLVECSAFVNWRRIERGSDAVLALSFCTGA